MLIPRSLSGSMLYPEPGPAFPLSVRSPVISMIRSASVDLPWSICAMIQNSGILLWSAFTVYSIKEIIAIRLNLVVTSFYMVPVHSVHVTMWRDKIILFLLFHQPFNTLFKMSAKGFHWRTSSAPYLSGHRLPEVVEALLRKWKDCSAKRQVNSSASG